MSASSAMPDVSLTVGAIVVSSWFSFFTMGICCVAAWNYFKLFPRDPLPFKVAVSLAMAMSLIDTISTGLWTYEWSVAHYGDPSIMVILPTAWLIEIFCLGSISLLVQNFYAWRLWKINPTSWYLPAVISVLSFVSWCMVLWLDILWMQNPTLAAVALAPPAGIYTWLVCAALADVLITGGMIYHLKFKYTGGHSGATFSGIISRTIQYNALSLLAQAVMIILFNIKAVGMYFVLADFTIIKVYTFSLLFSLNARRQGQASFASTGSESLPMPLGNLGSLRTPTRDSGHGSNHVFSVSVQNETTTDLSDKSAWEVSSTKGRGR